MPVSRTRAKRTPKVRFIPSAAKVGEFYLPGWSYHPTKGYRKYGKFLDRGRQLHYQLMQRGFYTVELMQRQDRRRKIV